MTGANSCLSILPSDVLMGRREPSGCKRRKGGVQLQCAGVFGRAFLPHSLQGSGRHKSVSQSVLVRSLASLTLLTHSSLQFSQALSTVTQDTLLCTPHAWYRFNSCFFFFVILFIVVLNVGYLPSYTCSGKRNLFPVTFIQKFTSNKLVHFNESAIYVLFWSEGNSFNIFCQKMTLYYDIKEKSSHLFCEWILNYNMMVCLIGFKL